MVRVDSTVRHKGSRQGILTGSETWIGYLLIHDASEIKEIKNMGDYRQPVLFFGHGSPLTIYTDEDVTRTWNSQVNDDGVRES